MPIRIESGCAAMHNLILHCVTNLCCGAGQLVAGPDEHSTSRVGLITTAAFPGSYLGCCARYLLARGWGQPLHGDQSPRTLAGGPSVPRS